MWPRPKHSIYVNAGNTFSMGVERGQVVPLRWHADYPVFSGGEDIYCNYNIVISEGISSAVSKHRTVLKCKQ